ncbi:hypothetical protein [Asaia sp. HN010]|uniref:hypothetical protein n=1 Tax=Asaia sp. HN010 TaxID=3081233 RepID=UPI003015E294
MNKFTEYHDDFIARYFVAVGADHLAAYDLPFTAEEITERYQFLLKNKPYVFATAWREEQMLEAYLEHDLTESMVAILGDFLKGKSPSRRGAAMSIKGLRTRGLIDDAMRLTWQGAEVAKLFREDALQ